MAWPKTLKMRFPVITTCVVAASLSIYAAPQLTDLFIYDRQHVLGGQFWRLFTAPFVHFSASHLIWNILVFAVAGSVTERAGYRRFAFVCIMAIVIPGLLFLASKPELARYGGLSALSIGATAYLSLCQAQQPCRGRKLWMAIFALLIVKISVECCIDAPIFAKPASIPFLVLPSAHAVGVAVAAAVFVFERRRIPESKSL